MGRLIAIVGRLTDDHDTAAVLLLIHHLAAVAGHLANLRETQQRLHQVRDARFAAQQLRAVTRLGATGGRMPAPSVSPVSGSMQSHARSPRPRQ